MNKIECSSVASSIEELAEEEINISDAQQQEYSTTKFDTNLHENDELTSEQLYSKVKDDYFKKICLSYGSMTQQQDLIQEPTTNTHKDSNIVDPKISSENMIFYIDNSFNPTNIEAYQTNQRQHENESVLEPANKLEDSPQDNPHITEFTYMDIQQQQQQRVSLVSLKESMQDSLMENLPIMTNRPLTPCQEKDPSCPEIENIELPEKLRNIDPKYMPPKILKSSCNGDYHEESDQDKKCDVVKTEWSVYGEHIKPAKFNLRSLIRSKSHESGSPISEFKQLSDGIRNLIGELKSPQNNKKSSTKKKQNKEMNNSRHSHIERGCDRSNENPQIQKFKSNSLCLKGDDLGSSHEKIDKEKHGLSPFDDDESKAVSDKNSEKIVELPEKDTAKVFNMASKYDEVFSSLEYIE